MGGGAGGATEGRGPGVARALVRSKAAPATRASRRGRRKDMGKVFRF